MTEKPRSWPSCDRETKANSQVVSEYAITTSCISEKLWLLKKSMSVPVTLLFVHNVYIGGSLVLEGKWVATLVELCSRLLSDNILDAQGNKSTSKWGVRFGFSKTNDDLRQHRELRGIDESHATSRCCWPVSWFWITCFVCRWYSLKDVAVAGCLGILVILRS